MDIVVINDATFGPSRFAKNDDMNIIIKTGATHRRSSNMADDVFSDGIRHDLLQYLPECGRNEQRSIPDGFRRTENHVAGCLRSGICLC